MRVVSLVPSVTETLLAWGVEPVACTRFCEQPALRHVGGTKDPDLDAIASLRPDLVVMDEEENRHQDAVALRDAGIEVYTTAVRSVDDVAATLKGLAEHVEVDAAGIAPPEVDVRADRAKGKHVFVPIWKRPWMTINADTYGSSVLAALGVVNVFADAPKRYPVVSLEDAVELGADAVLAPSEPYPFGPRHVSEMAVVGPVTLVDGQDLFWWGVRTPAAIDRLATAVL